MTHPFKVLCFSWNVGSLRMCESLSDLSSAERRKGFSNLILNKPPCIAPDFFREIMEKIYQQAPDLVIISTTNENAKGSYFHSDLIPNSLVPMGYKIIQHGVNKNNSTGTNIPQNREMTLLETVDKVATHITVAATQRVASQMYNKPSFQRIFGSSMLFDFKCPAGEQNALVYLFHHRLEGTFVFIVCDFDIGEPRDSQKSTECLDGLLKKLTEEVDERGSISHIFIMGDLNYDIDPTNVNRIQSIFEPSAVSKMEKIRELVKYDKLRMTIRSQTNRLQDFKEGISDMGPLFYPTWKLIRGRNMDCSPPFSTASISRSCFDSDMISAQGIGWHDRILYKDNFLAQNPKVTQCVEYNRIDIMNMRYSTHAGVWGLYYIS